MRILVIEDNPKMAGGIRRGLVEHGYAVDVSHSGYDGEVLATTTPYDVIVLDVMLPDRDGLDVCRSLRRRKVRTPILVLTALSGTREKVAGLDAGADDYLTKPFEFDELVARIRALLRRGQATEADKLAYADLEVNVTRRSVTRTGVKIDVSNKEFALLE